MLFLLKRETSMRKLFLLSACLLCLFPYSVGKVAAEDAEAHPTLVVFDFTSKFDEGIIGTKVAESLRTKASRMGKFIMADPYSIRDLLDQAELHPSFDTKPLTVANFLARTGVAAVAVWGDVVAVDGSHQIRAKALDLRKEENELLFERIEAYQSLREIPFISQRLVDILSGTETLPPPEVQYDKLLLGPNLVKNGNFERGKNSPLHWEKVDGLASFWVVEPAPVGKCIMFDTDVYVEEWKRWRQEFEAGTTTKPAPTKTPTSGHKYNTVGGTYGMHLYSDYISVERGATYVLSFDMKGRSSGDFMFAKVFVKGYALLGKQRREVYRAYKACRTRTKGKQWEHFQRVFHPTGRTPAVKWMRVMLYAHWPPGKYCFDNVRIARVVGEKNPGEAKPVPVSQEQTSVSE